MPKEVPISVDVPHSDRDKPGWVKVGVIAAVGFVVGIAWPRLVGVRLAPTAPGESAAAVSAASGQSMRSPEAPPASLQTKTSIVAAPSAAVSIEAPSSAASAKAPATAAPVFDDTPSVRVQKGALLSCKTASGDTKKSKECGSLPGLDPVVSPRVRKLSKCAAVRGQSGKLSLVVSADFKSGRVSYEIGKSSTLSNVDALAPCLKESFDGTSIKGVTHEHPRYTVAYSALFSSTPKVAAASASSNEADKPGDSSERTESVVAQVDSDRAAKESREEKSVLAAGEAMVTWDVALVREVPKTGEVLSRLPRGTKVKLGSPKDGWYLIKFGDGFTREGWVYRGAIGR